MNKKQADKKVQDQRTRATDAQHAYDQHAGRCDGVYASAESIVPQIGYAALLLPPILMNSVIAQQGMKELLAEHAGLTDNISPVVFSVLAAASVTLLVFMLALAKDDVQEERVGFALKVLAFLAASLFPAVLFGTLYNEAGINAMKSGTSYVETFLNNGPLLALGLIGFVGDSLVYFTAPKIQEAIAGMAQRWKAGRLAGAARKEQRLLQHLEAQFAALEAEEERISSQRKKYKKDKKDDEEAGGDSSSEQSKEPTAETNNHRSNGSNSYIEAIRESCPRRK